MPHISVIIPCYNAERWIRDTLCSVEAQQFAALEVIVVDDGSSDASAAIVAHEFPQVRLIRTPNGGPSRARNIGTQQASGAFIQYLDADDLLAPGKLQHQLDELAHSGGDVAYGDWQRIKSNENGQYSPAEIVTRQITGNPELALFSDFWCPPAAYLFRREIVERVGGWNEGLPVIQDARFALDCALHGGEFVYCPGVMAQYRVHSTNSVSTRNQVAFQRDCFHNACEIEAWWSAHATLTSERIALLRQLYSSIALSSLDLDATLSQQSCRAAQRVGAGRLPAKLYAIAVMLQLVGYRPTVAGVQLVRQVRQKLRSHL